MSIIVPVGDDCPRWCVASFDPPYFKKITYYGLCLLNVIFVLLSHACWPSQLFFDSMSSRLTSCFSYVALDSEKLLLFIESSKTDKYRLGAWVVVAICRQRYLSY